ncbi:MAG TPA: S8 family serine peptidase [Clostridia bacterium]|nr:S8 family serine peptidase [Clostridia bacterium]
MQYRKKFISLLLALIMVFSLAPVASANTADGNLSFSTTGKALEAENHDLETTELTFEDGADKAQLGNSGEVVINDIENVLAAKQGVASIMSTQEQQYVEDVAASLARPVGAIDISDLPPSQTIDIIVWLQELPTVLADAYGEANANSLTQGYAVKGATARRQIELAYADAIKHEYSAIFSGFAMTVTVSTARTIAKMSGVYAVTPDTMMYADEEAAATLDPTYQFEGMADSRRVLDIGTIHAAGITGDGVVVGVLDTGIDYNHPDFQGVYKGGYNYIDPAADYGRPVELATSPMETTYEQWQATDKIEINATGHSFYTDHGTHVSGTIAAQASNPASSASYKALGLAPDVDLYVARVLGPYGSGATSGIIAAVEDFTTGNSERGIPKADVINLSLGSDNNTAYGDNVFALNNAVIGGVNVAVSAGNNATGDASSMDARAIKTLGNPGTAYLPVTVAASQYGGTTVKAYDAVTATATDLASPTELASPTDVTFGLLLEGQNPSNTFASNSITGTPSPVYVDGKGYEAYLVFNTDDASTALEQLQAVPDGSLAGKILVVKRGAMNFTDFLAQALRTGAGALIIVNSAANGEKYITNMTIGGTAVGSLPIFSAFHSTSAKLTALAGGTNTVYLQLGNLSLAEQAKLPAYFSSIGPVNPTIGLKPDIIAPGWNIVSTAPAFITSPTHDKTDYSAAYQSMGGTSMSSPHIAAILALMVEAYPGATPAEIKARLMNTADTDLIEALPGTPASVLEVGAGFVNPSRAILVESASSTFVTVADSIPGATSGTIIENQTLSSLSFGLVEEAGSTSRTLPVTVHGGAGFTLSVIYNNNTRYSNNATANNVTLEYDAPVGGQFNVWVNVPAGAAEGYYEGWLVVTADGREYVLPWLVQVGIEEIPPFENLLFTAERPIISTSEDTSVRSAAGTTPLNSNSTTLFFAWEGAWPTDSNGYSDLDLFLINTETQTPEYYFGYVSIDGLENDGTTVYRVSDFISAKATRMSDFAEDVTVPNGTYYLSIYANDEYYVFDEIGLVFTDGTGDYEVQLTLDETIPVNADSSVTTATVAGRIYSPALDAAAEAGFLWTDVDDFWAAGNAYAIDQSFNVLGYSTTNDICISGPSAYNLYLDGGDPWICDEDGYFSLTKTVSQSDKNGGYVFDGSGNHAVVGVEGFYYNSNGTEWPLIGANKSGAVTPCYEEITTVNIAAIPGVTAPVRGATPVSTITETAQYTGTVTWQPVSGTYAASTVYTATITLTPKAGYTLTGVAENFFTVAGAAATNAANAGVITAVFPATESAPVIVPGGTPPTPNIPVTSLPDNVGSIANASATASSGAFNTNVEIHVASAGSNGNDALIKALARSFFNGSKSAARKLAILPLDISIFEQGTTNAVQPNPGASVTLTIPIPQNMLGSKESIVVGYATDDGRFLVLNTELVLVNGVYCVRFTTSHFSYYALIADVNAKLDTTLVPNTGSEASTLSMYLFAAALLFFCAGTTLKLRKRQRGK